jgi:hypothetical protein
LNPIPIFIISFNRLVVLKETIKSYYKYIKTPFEIIIWDTGTSFPDTLEYLESLRKNGIKIYKESHQQYSLKHHLYTKLNAVIENYFSTSKNKCCYYIATDPDISFHEETPGDVLEFYSFILDKFSNILKVGPMMKTDDIPDHYPLKQRVIETYLKRQYNKEMELIEFKNNIYKACSATLTPLGMYRRDTIFEKKILSFRCDCPYDAKHLDWYIDYKNMTNDQIFYMNVVGSANNMAHWSKEYLLDLDNKK